MKAETADALVAADRALANAQSVLSINIWDQAARLAYYAQFHAAQGYIFEQSGKVLKTHKGVHKQFHRMSLSEPMFPPGFAAQLSRAYLHKEAADYDTGATTMVTRGGASEALATAATFVSVVRQVLETGSAPSP